MGYVCHNAMLIRIPDCSVKCSRQMESVLHTTRHHLLKRNIMIQILNEVSPNAVGFVAKDNVTKADYETVVLPAVNEQVERTGKLNFLLELQTPISHFTFGAWMQDALLGLKQITKWNRVAIITDSATINKFTDTFGVFVPGTFKGFTPEEKSVAIAWVTEAA